MGCDCKYTLCIALHIVGMIKLMVKSCFGFRQPREGKMVFFSQLG